METPNYSFEVFIAEPGRAYVCNQAGILSHTIKDSASYIKGWLESLQGDKKFFFKAVGQAQKAADYILNFKYGTETTDEG